MKIRYRPSVYLKQVEISKEMYSAKSCPLCYGTRLQISCSRPAIDRYCPNCNRYWRPGTRIPPWRLYTSETMR